MFLVLLKKYQKHFENIFLILFIIWCVDLILFSIEIINFNNLGILLLVLFSLLLLLTIFFFFADPELKRNFLILLLSILFSLILISSIIEFSEKIRPEYNKKSFEETKKEYKEKIFMNAPIGIVERLGKKKLNKVDVLPLGGISNHINWMCNESDKNILYKADKYGFNNNNHNYLDKNIDLILIGDSFIFGECVEQNENISSNLREMGINSLSFGMVGHGPLLELATLREYGNKFKAKKIIWFFFENDFVDLELEYQVDALKQYLDQNYSNDLINKQSNINNFWLNYYNKNIDKEKTQKKNLLKKFERIILIKPIRDFIERKQTNYYQKNYLIFSEQNINILNNILKIAKENMKNINAELYFVYLPSIFSLDHGDPFFKKEVINIVKNLKINYLDFSEYLETRPNPKECFPLQTHGHYTATCYQKLSEIIYRKFIN